MPISVADLAKKLDLSPEAVVLHAMDLDITISDDDMLEDADAQRIEEVEVGDTLSAMEHEYEEKAEREEREKQAERTVGNKKKIAQKKERQKREKTKEEKPAIEPTQITDDGKVILPDALSVKDFATKIGKPVPIVLIKLKQSGVIANLKQEVDYETMAVVAADMGVEVKRQSAELSGEDLFRGDIKALLADEDTENLQSRPPVVCIMGHVDHGKTSILDYIRSASVADGEAGGITQRIGAYQVQVDGKPVTFLDTPGHEAFTAMRARGAKVTDIAVLVVAATEGLKPQTIEAISHIKEGEVPMVVAINKMDLAGANPDMVKGQLAEHGVNPDDWGGDVPCVPVSAKTGEGIEKLLETLVLVADMQELKANPNRTAIATVIESSQDKLNGVHATVLINTGTMKQGDPFVIYNQQGKIRNMKDHTGATLKTIGPSGAVQISGLSETPNVGDVLQVVKSVKEARKKAEEVAGIKHTDDLSNRKGFSLAQFRQQLKEGQMHVLKLIVKAESHGTLEAVVAELSKITTEGGMTKVIHQGIGDFTEGDIMLAGAGEALLVGFSVNMPGSIERKAEQMGIRVLNSEIIYELTEGIEDILLGKTTDDDAEVILGQFTIKAIFASNKKMAVIGGDVVSGKVMKKVKFRILEQQEEPNPDREDGLYSAGEGVVETVQIGQKEQNEVGEGAECGMRIKHDGLVFVEGMRLELFR